MHRFRDISKNVFSIQQIFTCKQYGALRPDSQQPNPSNDLSIDKHWPWRVLPTFTCLWLLTVRRSNTWWTAVVKTKRLFFDEFT